LHMTKIWKSPLNRYTTAGKVLRHGTSHGLKARATRNVGEEK
jgi:hypothetical protein